MLNAGSGQGSGYSQSLDRGNHLARQTIWRNDALEQFQNKGMDESIWPEKITDNMDVRDFLMIYY